MKDALETTLRYNFGRVCEDTGEENEAERAYQAIIKKHPAYVDAHLRLGYVAQQRGHLEDAAKHYQNALKQDPTSVEAHVQLGTLQLMQNQTRAAKRSFEKVLGQIDKFDLVSLLQLGNIWLHTPAKDAEGHGKNLAEAYKMYDRVLALDPRNPYAANGLAMALREKGWVDEALRIFEQVRESDDSVSCFAVNYAHMLAELGHYKRAIPLV
jgi:RNA polymerase-associated protein CTR9